jgi:hypothetical protein
MEARRDSLYATCLRPISLFPVTDLLQLNTMVRAAGEVYTLSTPGNNSPTRRKDVRPVRIQ